MELKMYPKTRPVPRYCPNCGAILNKTDFLYDHDTQTGKRRYGTKLSCSSVRGFLHPSWDFDPEGNELIQRYP